MVRARNVTHKQRERYNLHLANHGGMKCRKRVLPPFFLRFFVRLLFAILFICVQSLRAQAPQASSAPQASAAAPPAGPQPTVTPEMGDVGGNYFGQAARSGKRPGITISPRSRSCGTLRPKARTPFAEKPFPSFAAVQSRRPGRSAMCNMRTPEFSARVLPAERLGILGPVLRGTTGEYHCRDDA